MLRRQSVETLESVIDVFKRRSVTEEILGIASSALQRVIEFKDEVMQNSEGTDEIEYPSTELRVVVSEATDT